MKRIYVNVIVAVDAETRLAAESYVAACISSEPDLKLVSAIAVSDWPTPASATTEPRDGE